MYTDKNGFGCHVYKAAGENEILLVSYFKYLKFENIDTTDQDMNDIYTDEDLIQAIDDGRIRGNYKWYYDNNIWRFTKDSSHSQEMFKSDYVMTKVSDVAEQLAGAGVTWNDSLRLYGYSKDNNNIIGTMGYHAEQIAIAAVSKTSSFKVPAEYNSSMSSAVRNMSASIIKAQEGSSFNISKEDLESSLNSVFSSNSGQRIIMYAGWYRTNFESIVPEVPDPSDVTNADTAM